MSSWGLDAGSGDPRIHIRLADANDAAVGMHLHDQVVLRRGRGPDVIAGVEQYVAVNPSYTHGIA